MKDVTFWKMHGAGNDFMLVDDREGAFPVDPAWMARTCARRTGVGCEGLILIRLSVSADFRMVFFNPDGGEADMCGNGARCAARLAHDLGLAPRLMRIETAAGCLGAEILERDRVRLGMTDPRHWRMAQRLEVAGETLLLHAVDTGVPHAVMETDDLDGEDVACRGAAIRRHKAFAPAGVNANFIQVTGPDSLRIRTYERGVEAETLACGTGITAAALVAARLGLVRPPVRVRSAGGHLLEVGLRLTDEGADGVTLSGPAEYVYRGVIAGPTER